MAVQALTRDSMPKGEGDLSIEGHGIEPIPESARYGAVWRLFTVWFTPNLVPAAFAIGVLARRSWALASPTVCWRSSSATSSGPPSWAS